MTTKMTVESVWVEGMKSMVAMNNGGHVATFELVANPRLVRVGDEVETRLVGVGYLFEFEDAISPIFEFRGPHGIVQGKFVSGVV
jgi:hypothetical protein